MCDTEVGGLCSVDALQLLQVWTRCAQQSKASAAHARLPLRMSVICKRNLLANAIGSLHELRCEDAW